MSAQTDAPEAYLVGHADGQLRAAASAARKLLAAEDLIRALGDELDQTRSLLTHAQSTNRRLREKLAAPHAIALRWSIVTGLLTFIATWNVAT